MGIVAFLISLSVMIFIHELGHFLVAKYFGVKVEVFSIGFGTKIYSKMISGTEWKISSIPLGGYVKMKGQDDTDPTKIVEGEDSYNSKKPWQRILILLAGPFANIFLTLILYFIISLGGTTYVKPIVGEIVPNSPAQIADMKKGDKILTINNQKIQTWNEISDFNKDNTLTLKIQRKNQIINITLTPKTMQTKNIFGERIEYKMMGISPDINQTLIVKHDLQKAISLSFERTKYALSITFLSLQKILDGTVPATQMSGIIGIAEVSTQAYSVGILALLSLMALISANLALLNLLPIPALDGGHIVFNLYEMIFRRPVTAKIVFALTALGWILLLGLMFFTTYNDILRLING